MNYKSHRLTGVCAGLVAGTLLTKGNTDTSSLITLGLITANSAIGSAIPDIDHPGSHVGKNVKIVSSAINMVAGHRGAFHSPIVYLIVYFILSMLIKVYIPYKAINILIKSLFLLMAILFAFGKRSLTSYVMTAVGMYLFFISNEQIDMISLLQIILQGIFIGIFSHLFLDSLTTSGIPMLYPFSKKKYNILRLKTNKHELLSQLLVLIPTVIFLFFMYYSFFISFIK